MAASGIRSEGHTSHRAGWLRAAVLGANDGIVSTASLVLGVAAASATRGEIVTAGIAGLLAGSLSMAAGEYVSVSSQRDAERADILRERRELEENPARELDELAAIYEQKGLEPALARRVAEQLSEGDALRVHAHDELGLDVDELARPWQATWLSALSFSIGAALPLIVIATAAASVRVPATVVATLIALIGLGIVGAQLGGAGRARGAVRVLIGGAAAMAITYAVGAAIGTAV